MHEFQTYTKKVFQTTFLTLLAFCILWIATPYKMFFQGLLLGTSFSLINGWFTYLKAVQITGAAINPELSNKPRGAGMVSRMALAIFAVYLSLKYPTLFSLTGVFIGLFILQIYALFHSFILYYVKR